MKTTPQRIGSWGRTSKMSYSLSLKFPLWAICPHHCFSLIYSWFDIYFSRVCFYFRPKKRETEACVAFLWVSFFYENPDLAATSSALYKQAQTHHKYFTLILNAVSISLNQSSKRDYKILLHEIIMRPSKKRYKYCRKQTQNLETRTFSKLVNTT